MKRAADVPEVVQWHDGMLLSPQHFQESFRRAEELLEFHLAHLAPYHFGVIQLEIDLGLLVTGMLRVVEVEAVMPDGTLVHHRAQDDDLSVDLRPMVKTIKKDHLTVFLVVPRAHLGRSEGELVRHRSIEGPPVADHNTGEDELVIPRLVPNTRLLVGDEPPARFIALPIARIRLDGEAFVRTDYVPPVLSVTSTSVLGKIGISIVNRLREKALRLADKMSALSLTIDRDIIVELRRQIDCLVGALPPFEVAMHTERAHPYSLYLALAALVGKLAALSRTPIPPALPPYRHDELRMIFETARDHLFRMVDEGILESFTAHPLNFEGGRFMLQFHREWKGRQLVLAAKSRRGIPEDELLTWLQGSLIGASSKARAMQESRVLGISRKRIERSGDLVATKGTFLYEMDEASPYLGLGEQLLVFNTADPSGAAGPVELVLYVKALG